MRVGVHGRPLDEPSAKYVREIQALLAEYEEVELIYTDRFIKELDSAHIPSGDNPPIALEDGVEEHRRIQNSIVGEIETCGLEMIVRIASTTDTGRLLVDAGHGFTNGTVVLYRVGIGEALCTDEGELIAEGEAFVLRVMEHNPQELELHCIVAI